MPPRSRVNPDLPGWREFDLQRGGLITGPFAISFQAHSFGICEAGEGESARIASRRGMVFVRLILVQVNELFEGR